MRVKISEGGRRPLDHFAEVLSVDFSRGILVVKHDSCFFDKCGRLCPHKATQYFFDPVVEQAAKPGFGWRSAYESPLKIQLVQPTTPPE